MLPLPQLSPAWVLSETECGAKLSGNDFLDRLGQRRWSLATPAPGDPIAEPTPDLVSLDLSALSPADLGKVRITIEEARARRLPLLIHGPASLYAACADICSFRPVPTLPEDLFKWWGPERMEEELVRNTPDIPITGITAGLRWAMVETENATGLAAMPMLASGEADEISGFDVQDFCGKSLRSLAAEMRRSAGVGRALACAAINAGIPRPDRLSSDDGLLSEPGREGDRTVIVGRFPELARKRPGAIVLEKNPGPDDLPSDAAPYVIPGADTLVVTASAWSNGSLSGLLRLAATCRVSLVGPGTPLSPALHAYGIHRLAGFTVEDRENTRAVIARGEGVKAFKRFGRQVLISES